MRAWGFVGLILGAVLATAAPAQVVQGATAKAPQLQVLNRSSVNATLRGRVLQVRLAPGEKQAQFRFLVLGKPGMEFVLNSRTPMMQVSLRPAMVLQVKKGTTWITVARLS